MSDSDQFYTINITTGALTSVGTINNGALTTKSIAAAKLGPLGRYIVIAAARTEHRLNVPPFRGSQTAKRKQG